MRDELSATSALLVSVNQSLSYLVQNDSNALQLEFLEFVEYSIIGYPDHELCRRNNTCEIAFYHEYFEDDSYCTYEQLPDDTECWDHCLVDNFGTCREGICTGECPGW